MFYCQHIGTKTAEISLYKYLLKFWSSLCQ